MPPNVSDRKCMPAKILDTATNRITIQVSKRIVFFLSLSLVQAHGSQQRLRLVPALTVWALGILVVLTVLAGVGFYKLIF